MLAEYGYNGSGEKNFCILTAGGSDVRDLRRKDS